MAPVSPLALITLLALAVAAAAQCTSGWTLYPDSDGTEGGSSCLQYFTTGVSWAVANTSCLPGAHLVTVRATAFPSGLTTLIATLSSSANYWVGATQRWAQPWKNVGWYW